MTAEVFAPLYSTDGCDLLSMDKELADGMDKDHKGFVLVKVGGCSYQQKMRNIQ